MIYGYCRVSTATQNIDRQIRNIKKIYPDAVIISEEYTGTTLDRPKWIRLIKQAKSGDTIVFDSVSRMSRNADEGVKEYFQLFDDGIQLIFLIEPYINTSVYEESCQDKLKLIGTDEDEILKGLNNYFRKLATKQIRLAFEQAEKEVSDLRQRTREGIYTAKLANKQIGRKKGIKVHSNKERTAMSVICIHSKSFGGSLNDAECQKLAGVSRNTYYKYKKILQEKIKRGE